jgi:RNA polymerase sigma-70 factor (ECF subfamily)
MGENLEDIYSRYSGFAYNVALRMLGNTMDAEDVLQDVFVKLQNKLSSFNGDSSIKTFLYRMVINQSIDHIRRHGSQTSRAEKSMLDIRPAMNDDSLLLYSMLETITVEQRSSILLYEICGFTQKEVASILNVTQGTIKSRISRGITKMAASACKEV